MIIKENIIKAHNIFTFYLKLRFRMEEGYLILYSQIS